MEVETFLVQGVELQYLLMTAPKRRTPFFEAKVCNQDLDEIIIRCNKCANEIHLTGFSLLQKLSDPFNS